MSPWQEERSEQAQASNRMSRERILTSSGEDVTEAVVSVLDCLHGSLDWGSGFLADTDVEDAMHLMQILGFKCWQSWYEVPIPRHDGREHRAWDAWREAEHPLLGPCLRVIGHDGEHEAATTPAHSGD